VQRTACDVAFQRLDASNPRYRQMEAAQGSSRRFRGSSPCRARSAALREIRYGDLPLGHARPRCRIACRRRATRVRGRRKWAAQHIGRRKTLPCLQPASSTCCASSSPNDEPSPCIVGPLSVRPRFGDFVEYGVAGSLPAILRSSFNSAESEAGRESLQSRRVAPPVAALSMFSATISSRRFSCHPRACSRTDTSYGHRPRQLR